MYNLPFTDHNTDAGMGETTRVGRRGPDGIDTRRPGFPLFDGPVVGPHSLEPRCAEVVPRPVIDSRPIAPPGTSVDAPSAPASVLGIERRLCHHVRSGRYTSDRHTRGFYPRTKPWAESLGGRDALGDDVTRASLESNTTSDRARWREEDRAVRRRCDRSLSLVGFAPAARPDKGFCIRRVYR